MNKLIVRSRLVLLLVTLAMGETLLAQSTQPRRADTLRRELTVMTEDAVVLGTRQPQDLAYSIPAPTLTPLRYSYQDTPIPFALTPSIEPLSALGPMKGGFTRADQRGYLTLAGGISMNLRAGAGYRIISTKDDLFDVYGRLYWSDNPISNDLLIQPKAKELAWGLGAYYRHHFEDPTLEIRLGWRQLGHNYYGLTTVTTGQTSSTTLTQLPITKLSTGLFDLDARLALADDPTAEWLYDARFRLGYAGTKYADGVWRAEPKPTEWLPRLSLDLSNRLSSTTRWGVQGDLSVSILSFPSLVSGLTQEQAISTSRMILSAAPYFLADDTNDDFSWRFLGGLRLSNGSDRKGAHLYLFPRIDASLTYTPYIQLRLETDAEHRRLGLGDMSQVMPYLDAYTFPDLLERIYWAKLSLTTTIAERLSAVLSARYAGHRGATQFRPFAYNGSSLGVSAVQVLSPISFTPYYADYGELALGADLMYNHRGLFRASLGGEYTKYLDPTDLLSGKAEYKIRALAELSFIPKVDLRIGYDLTGAVRYYDLSGKSTKLKASHLLHADLALSLTKSLSLTAEARALLLGSQTRWWGYHQQPLVALLGLQYRF